MLPLVAAALVAAAVGPLRSSAQALTQDEALALAFPGADFERRTAYLDDAQLDRATRLAGPAVPIESTIVTYYVASLGGRAVGVSYFDVHRVRTLPEVLMVVVGSDERIRRIESVAFHEPPEYRAPNGWLRQFDDAGLDEDLSLKGGIANLTGASLTAGAVTRAARRTLALHAVIDPLGEGRR